MRPHEQSTFTSWKEIADYLGKGVRTVQRWESRFGLPIQRPNQHDRGIVRVSRADLDNWLRTHWRSGARSRGATVARHDLSRCEILQRAHELRNQLGLLRREFHDSCSRFEQTMAETVRIFQNLPGNIRLPASVHDSRTSEDNTAVLAGVVKHQQEPQDIAAD